MYESIKNRLKLELKEIKNSGRYKSERIIQSKQNSKIEVNDGENVYLRGFGTFAVKKRAEKTARNITKNTIIKVPSHNVPTFKACKSFKNGVSKQNPC